MSQQNPGPCSSCFPSCCDGEEVGELHILIVWPGVPEGYPPLTPEQITLCGEIAEQSPELAWDEEWGGWAGAFGEFACTSGQCLFGAVRCEGNGRWLGGYMEISTALPLPSPSEVGIGELTGNKSCDGLFLGFGGQSWCYGMGFFVTR